MLITLLSYRIENIRQRKNQRQRQKCQSAPEAKLLAHVKALVPEETWEQKVKKGWEVINTVHSSPLLQGIQLSHAEIEPSVQGHVRIQIVQPHLIPTLNSLRKSSRRSVPHIVPLNRLLTILRNYWTQGPGRKSRRMR